MDISAVWTAGGAGSFLLAFTRIGSMFLPLGLPGVSQSPIPPRIALAGLITIALWPEWLQVAQSGAEPPSALSFFAELSFGLLAGLTANAVLEALQFGLHMAGLQSGYQYASTIDPSSQADSAVLPVLGQLFGFALFLAMRGDHLLIRVLARSFEVWPAGSIPLGAIDPMAIASAMKLIFETGLAFALPLIGLLVLVDLSLGVVTRAHAQLQLISIAFPIKMLLAMFTIAALLPAWSTLFGSRMAAVELALKKLLTSG